MKIPKELIFSGRKIKVEKCSPESIKMRGYNGRAIYDLGLILLANDMGEGMEARVFLEEVLHCILSEAGFEEESKDEKLVQTISSGVFSIIRNNKLDFNK
ncbi:MAG TPA: hypothetical protein ENH82_01955 [bacterium]|nr:hypothetical protein [bacterium]